MAAAIAVAIAVAALVIAIFAAIADAAWVGGAGGGGVPVDIAHLVRMTALQAGLSTLVSLLVGVALAWALNRLRFAGRGLVIGLFSSAIVTPGVIVAFGILSVWGRAGWIAAATGAVFGRPLVVPLFGLAGILFAHVILDAAFAARVLLTRLDTVPLARLKTGRSLGLSPWQRFALIDWPLIRTSLPGLAAIIFLLAFTSFPIVLLLGGGPANQTLEVAIYSAVRLDFNLPAAIHLALTQIGICAAIIVMSALFAPMPGALARPGGPAWPDRGPARLLQGAILVISLIGFALPLLAALADGLAADWGRLLARPAFWNAALTSLAIATASALLTLVATWWLAAGRAATASRTGRVALTAPAFTYLAVPAVVLSLGFFLIVRSLGIAPEAAGPAVVVIANTLLALPFGLATLGPPLESLTRSRGRLIRALGLSGWQQFRLVEWPLLGREIGMVAALAFCFSLGDVGVISLFGTERFVTLPLMMVRALTAYRGNDAAGIAALMLALTVVAFWALPVLFERLADARA
jgi:thiamine transport system permease protein